MAVSAVAVHSHALKPWWIAKILGNDGIPKGYSHGKLWRCCNAEESNSLLNYGSMVRNNE